MGLILNYDEGQTPIDEDEKEGLLINTVSTKGELDELEQRNIEEAMLWAIRSFRTDDILTEDFIKAVHIKMLGKVWKWAGTFRNTNKNIGVDKYEIATSLRTLLDDCRYWVTNNTFPAEETAIRFKHRLVSIHCFVNGNGRHSRLMADLIIEKLFKQEVFTWGSSTLIKADNARRTYLDALRAADSGNYELLLKFARS